MKIVMRSDLAEQGFHVSCNIPGRSKKRLLSSDEISGAQFIKFSPNGMTVRLREENELIEVNTEEVEFVS